MARADLPPLPKPGDIVMCAIAPRKRPDGQLVECVPAVVICVGQPYYSYDPIMIDVFLFCEAIDLYSGPGVRAWAAGPRVGNYCWPRTPV